MIRKVILIFNDHNKRSLKKAMGCFRLVLSIFNRVDYTIKKDNKKEIEVDFTEEFADFPIKEKKFIDEPT